MKKTDLTNRNAAELHTMLNEARAHIAQFRFDLADKKLKRTSDIATTRRSIARILTALKTTGEGSRRGTRPGIASAK